MKVSPGPQPIAAAGKNQTQGGHRGPDQSPGGLDKGIEQVYIIAHRGTFTRSPKSLLKNACLYGSAAR